MARILRYVLLLMLFLFARALLRSLFSGVRRAGSRDVPDTRRSGSAPVGGELKKDPVCGTYVAALGSPSATVNGEVYYFCSPECRDKYALIYKH